MNIVEKIRWYSVSLIRNITGIVSVILMPVVFLIAFLSRFAKKKYDIGMGPMPLINYVYLKKSLESQGYSVQTYVTGVYKITSDFDCIMINWLYRRAPFLRIFPVLFKYRCLYFFFDGGVLANRKVYRRLEAYIYKAAGIKTVVMPYGSDCTTPEHSPNFCFRNMSFLDYGPFFRKNHNKIIWRVKYWCRNADYVIAMADYIDYLIYWDRITTSYFSVDLDKLKPQKDFQFVSNGKFHIVHAPNHMELKGTKFIEAAIKRLTEEGYDIQYDRLHGKTNDEVLEVLKQADIVIDQIIIGWHGIFALEASAFGKPVITYIRDDLRNAYEEIGCLKPGELPMISAKPTTIYSVLKDLLDHPDTLAEFGRNSREYVEKHHSIEVIGQFFAEINREIGIMPMGKGGCEE